MSQNFQNYFHAVKYLESLSTIPKPELMRSRGSGFYLNRTKKLIKKLNINLSQFKFIHVAGTAGKGTTVALVHQILFKAGHKVGSFYSPHPTTSIERVRVNAKYISPNDFGKITKKLKPVIQQMYLDSKYGVPSYFEIFFALALLYFQQKKSKYVILETGCGGEFDATNIIKKPLITAITNINYDHTHILGKTLKKIARTKSKIIKPNSIFLTTEQRPELLEIFQNECEHRKIKKHFFLPPISDGQALPCKKPPIPNSSSINPRNISLATAICRELNIAQKYINQGIKQNFLSCRFEIIQTKPIVVLDGAHNPAKIKVTAENLSQINYNRLFLILAINQNKNYEKIIKIIAPKASNVYLTRHLNPDRPCVDLKLMYNQFLVANKKLKPLIFLDPWQALNMALNKTKPNDLILITGSFYLSGELRQYWINEQTILSEAE